MKTPLYLALLFLIFSVGCKGQTPEQQKMMEDMGKKGLEAQRQLDSVMNSSQVNRTIQLAEAMEANAKIDRDNKTAEKQKEMPKPDNSKNDIEGYLISGSNAKKLDNWMYGEAKIVMVTLGQNSSPIKHVLGAISSDGGFDIQLPAKVETGNTIKENKFLGCGYFGGKGIISYSNSNVGALRASIQIEKNSKPIGWLGMATDIEVVEGWNPLQHDYHNIPGYRLEWYYVSGETSAKGRCVKENRDGDGKDYDLTKVYNVHLKQGWNLVKTAYDGERILIDWGKSKHSYYKVEKFTAVTSMPADARWVFKAN